MTDNSIRDKIIEKFKKDNIDFRLSFPPVHIQPYYINKYGFKENDFPNSIKNKTFLDIPIFAQMDDESQKRVIDSILSVDMEIH